MVTHRSEVCPIARALFCDRWPLHRPLHRQCCVPYTARAAPQTPPTPSLTTSLTPPLRRPYTARAHMLYFQFCLVAIVAQSSWAPANRDPSSFHTSASCLWRWCARLNSCRWLRAAVCRLPRPSRKVAWTTWSAIERMKTTHPEVSTNYRKYNFLSSSRSIALRREKHQPFLPLTTLKPAKHSGSRAVGTSYHRCRSYRCTTEYRNARDVVGKCDGFK